MPLTGREMYIDSSLFPTKSSGVVARVQLELSSGELSLSSGSVATWMALHVHVSIEQMIPLIWRVVLS